MKRFCTAALVLVFLTAAVLASAADKPDPTGTWKWTVTFGQNSREVTLKLKLDGDKLTGAMLGATTRKPPSRTPPTRTATWPSRSSASGRGTR